MTETGFTLHGFFRSSASFRVRIGLNIKALDVAQKNYVLRKGDQRGDDYLAINPQGLVPMLEMPDGTKLSQSLAILEWLDEAYPEPPLLPADLKGRGRVRELAHMVALDIHPLNNLRVLGYLSTKLGADEDAVADWFRHWAALAFEALETHLSNSRDTGTFCHQDEVSIADICLVAQSVNNRRFAVDEAPYPNIRRIVEHCLTFPAFEKAFPENQPDASL